MTNNRFTTETDFAELLGIVLSSAGYRDPDHKRWVALHVAAERGEVSQDTLMRWIKGEGLTTVAAFSRLLEAHGYEIKIKRSATGSP